MGTVPIGIGALRRIQSRVVWMLRPVERSITVSAPQRIAHTILSTSSSTDEVTAELPMLALILVRKLRPMIIGSSSAWLMLDGMIARPRPLVLRDRLAGKAAQRLVRRGKCPREVLAGHVAVVDRLDRPPVIWLDA